MTITFESDSDVMVYTLENIISFTKESQYIFAANCVWWIAGGIGWDTGLTIYFDYLYIGSQVCQQELLSTWKSPILEISSTPRDIGR
jgi:hypothetical protein